MLCNFSVVPKPPWHWMETSSTENISGHTEPAKWLTEAALQSKCPKVLCRAWHKNHCCFDCLIWQAMWRAPVKQRRWLLPPVELKVSKSYLRLPRATHYSILNGMLKYWSITEFEEQARRKYNTANLCKNFSNVQFYPKLEILYWKHYWSALPGCHAGFQVRVSWVCTHVIRRKLPIQLLNLLNKNQYCKILQKWTLDLWNPSGTAKHTPASQNKFQQNITQYYYKITFVFGI